MQYLISAWNDNSLVTALGEKNLFVNNNNDCYTFPVKRSKNLENVQKKFLFDAGRSWPKDNI